MLDRNMGRTTSTEDFAVEFGHRLRAQRLKRGWTQEQLAEEVGLHFTYISSVERGERNVTLKTILRLATALGVNAAELVDQLPPVHS